jgi:hypothetical protein
MVARDIEATVAALHHEIRAILPDVRRIFIEVQSHQDYRKEDTP